MFLAGFARLCDAKEVTCSRLKGLQSAEHSERCWCQVHLFLDTKKQQTHNTQSCWRMYPKSMTSIQNNSKLIKPLPVASSTRWPLGSKYKTSEKPDSWRVAHGGSLVDLVEGHNRTFSGYVLNQQMIPIVVPPLKSEVERWRWKMSNQQHIHACHASQPVGSVFFFGCKSMSVPSLPSTVTGFNRFQGRTDDRGGWMLTGLNVAGAASGCWLWNIEGLQCLERLLRVLRKMAQESLESVLLTRWMMRTLVVFENGS